MRLDSCVKRTLSRYSDAGGENPVGGPGLATSPFATLNQVFQLVVLEDLRGPGTIDYDEVPNPEQRAMAIIKLRARHRLLAPRRTIVCTRHIASH